MEKRAVIEEGRTPSESAGKPLEDHVIKRAADAAKEQIAGGITRADIVDALKFIPKAGQ